MLSQKNLSRKPLLSRKYPFQTLPQTCLSNCKIILVHLWTHLKNPPNLTKGLFLPSSTNSTIHTGWIMWSITETWPAANLLSIDSNVPQENNVSGYKPGINKQNRNPELLTRIFNSPGSSPKPNRGTQTKKKLSVRAQIIQTRWQIQNCFHAPQHGGKLSMVLSLPYCPLLLFHLLPPKSLSIISRAFGPPRSWVCVCVWVFLGGKTPLIRCHVVLEAVTCQGSSRYLSVTAGLFSVCG